MVSVAPRRVTQLLVQRLQGAVELVTGERVRQRVEHEGRARTVVVERSQHPVEQVPPDGGSARVAR